MPRRESFGFWDPQTQHRVSITAYPSVESAERMLEGWKERQRNGGRPDISKELLDRLEIRRTSDMPEL